MEKIKRIHFNPVHFIFIFTLIAMVGVLSIVGIGESMKAAEAVAWDDVSIPNDVTLTATTGTSNTSGKLNILYYYNDVYQTQVVVDSFGKLTASGGYANDFSLLIPPYTMRFKILPYMPKVIL